MFKIKTNEKIGEYLLYQISQKYPSTRQFCKAYLRTEGMAEDDNDEIRKMENRMSQILNGKKSIQVYDLPIISELLDVTCEQILSAGENSAPKATRVTNYSIAYSKSQKEWDEYINRDDRLILNPDEYNNTVIDYAIEAGNYEFIKYLMDKKYIWFVDNEQNNNFAYETFGAGTRIERRNPVFTDMLKYRLESEDNLRMKIIELATVNKDIKTLESLKAREIPMLYNVVRYTTFEYLDRENDYKPSRLVELIADAEDEIIEYFTTPFEITDPRQYKDSTKRICTFLFPFYSELLMALIKRNHRCAEQALRTAIAHNKSTYEQLKYQIEESVDYMDQFINIDENILKKKKRAALIRAAEDINFYEKLHIISFSDYHKGNITKTNIVFVPKISNVHYLDNLIKEVNSLYKKINTIRDEYASSEDGR